MAETTRVPKRIQPLSFGGLAFVITSTVLSLVSYGHLPNTVRIYWTLDSSYHYGPEYVSSMVALIAFPLLVAGLYVGARWFKTYLASSISTEGDGKAQAIYDSCILATLGMIVAVHLLIIILNL